MNLRILNAEPGGFNAQARIILQSIGELHEEACSRQRLLELIPEFDVLIVRLGHHIDREILQRSKRVRAIVSATTGLNHIDMQTAKAMGIEVLSLKGESDFLKSLTATAELTWALLLSLMKRLPEAYQQVEEGVWDRDRIRGRQLKGKVIGIIGFGRLGSMVAEYGHSFQMQVLASDPHVDAMPDWVARVDQATLLQQADVITLHVNLEPETSSLLDADAFACIKEGAVLINTSRGELVDEIALLDALETGRLAGAGLDVLVGEAANDPKWPISSPVWRYAQSNPNVVLVPHIGGATIESMADTEIFMAKKLKQYLVGSLAGGNTIGINARNTSSK